MSFFHTQSSVFWTWATVSSERQLIGRGAPVEVDGLAKNWPQKVFSNINYLLSGFANTLLKVLCDLSAITVMDCTLA